MDQPTRFPWNHFPPVYIHASESFVRTHHAYIAAKAGDGLAAMELVADTMSPYILERLWRRFDSRAPILVNAHAEEASGVNAIPDAMARAISAFLKWPRERRIIQTNKVSHTGASGYERLQRQATFAGRILIGLNYLLVDDFVGQGGTLANLRGHILAQQGYVIGATVLSGKDYSAELALTEANYLNYGGSMDTSSIGGDSGSASDSNPSPRQKPDILAELAQLKESLRAWKQLIAEGKVESLVVKIESPPELEGIPYRMLTEREQRQLRISKRRLHNYYNRMLQTPKL